mmetsp:Transcript_30325/g.72157  ORF Transcript_30325/g.72157 Transcript_30325/m.72157 type:complete len:87 (+) Transcript_30325:367-627(+)
MDWAMPPKTMRGGADASPSSSSAMIFRSLTPVGSEVELAWSDTTSGRWWWTDPTVDFVWVGGDGAKDSALQQSRRVQMGTLCLIVG